MRVCPCVLLSELNDRGIVASCEIDMCSAIQDFFHMSHPHGGMVLEASPGQSDQLILQIRDFADAAASEERFLNGVVRKPRFAGIHNLRQLFSDNS